MELRQLEAFAAVMTTGSITGAARLLAKSQPATSRLVQELEAEIGYALFTRHGPRVAPTREAFLLHEDAERALAGLRQMHLRAAEIARGDPRPLLIAATSALAVGLLPQALKAAQIQTGPMPVQLRTASPEQVVQSVLGASVQLGLCSLPLEHRGLKVHWIGRLDCVAVLGRNDPLAQQTVVPLAALAQRRLITMSNLYRLRHRLDAELARSGGSGGSDVGRRSALIETNSSMNALAMVRAGLGVAVLEPLTARGAPLPGVVVRPLDAAIPFFFGAITARVPTAASNVLAVVDAALDAARRLPGFVQVDPSEHARLLQGAGPSKQAPAPLSASAPASLPAPARKRMAHAA